MEPDLIGLLSQWGTLEPKLYGEFAESESSVEEIAIVSVLKAIERHGWSFSLSRGNDQRYSVAIYPPSGAKLASDPSVARALLTAYLTCLEVRHGTDASVGA